MKNNERWNKKKYLFSILGISSAFLFSLATPLSKLLLIEINQFLLAGLLYFGGVIGIFPLLIKKKELNFIISIKLFKLERKKIIMSIVFGGILGPVLFLFGLQLAKAGSVSIWLNMELVATSIIGFLFFKETLDRNGIIGVILMVLSGVLITLQEGLQNGFTGILSAIFIVLACICWGIDNHTTAIIEHLSATQTTFIKGLIAGFVNSVIGIGLMVYLDGNWSSFTLGLLRKVGLSILLGTFSYGISILFYILTAQQLGSTRGQILFSSAPLFGILMSFAILRESLGWFHFVAVLFTIGGIFFSYKTTHSHKHKHESLTHLHVHSHNDDHHTHVHKNDENEQFTIHSHEHEHDEVEHMHRHYPDIHHRHQ